MFIAIIKLIGLVGILATFVIWIISVVNSDGKCHSDTCEGCPYESEYCPWKGKNHE